MARDRWINDKIKISANESKISVPRFIQQLGQFCHIVLDSCDFGTGFFRLGCSGARWLLQHWLLRYWREIGTLTARSHTSACWWRKWWHHRHIDECADRRCGFIHVRMESVHKMLSLLEKPLEELVTRRQLSEAARGWSGHSCWQKGHNCWMKAHSYLKGLSHEIDFKNFDKILQNLV